MDFGVALAGAGAVLGAPGTGGAGVVAGVDEVPALAVLAVLAVPGARVVSAVVREAM